MKLREINRMTVLPLPILRQSADQPSQNMRGQVRDPNPRQDQKARVVSHQPNVAPTRRWAPADVTVRLPRWRGAELQARHAIGRRFARTRYLKMLAHRLLIAQIMMMSTRPLKSDWCAVRFTCSIAMGLISLRAPVSGV